MIKKSKLAVLIVDMQDYFLKNFTKDVREQLIQNHLKVINFCDRIRIPIIVLEFKCVGNKKVETTAKLSSVLRKMPNTVRVQKESNSGFTDTNLEQILTDLKCKKIVLMGINANGCVQDTAISAIKRGYRVMTSKGLLASSSRNNMALSKKNEAWYAKNTALYENLEELLSEICK